MDILDRYASSEDRNLLSELADYLEACRSKSIPPQKALSVVGRLAFAVERKGAHDAWICLWRLSDGTANSLADKFLSRLQKHVHCKSILENCFPCLTRGANEQRLACVKFLVAFMAQSGDRQRLVCDTTDLLSHLLRQVGEEINLSETSDLAFQYTLVTNYISLVSHASIKQLAIGLVYGKRLTTFYELEGLQALTHCFQTLTDYAVELAEAFSENQFRQCYEECISVTRTMWDFLTLNAQTGGVNAHSALYTYTEHEVKFAAQSLNAMLHRTQRDNTTELSLVRSFLAFVESHRKEVILSDCLRYRSERDVDSPGLLAVFATGLVALGDAQLLSDVCQDFVRWRAEYPMVAAVVEQECFVSEDVRKVLLDPSLPSTHLDSVEPTAQPSSVSVGKDRHCQYPDCTVSGTGTEYTWKCARCCTAYYCSRDLQKRHWWAAHKAVCRNV
jgi:hypothetical protein